MKKKPYSWAAAYLDHLEKQVPKATGRPLIIRTAKFKRKRKAKK